MNILAQDWVEQQQMTRAHIHGSAYRKQGIAFSCVRCVNYLIL